MARSKPKLPHRGNRKNESRKVRDSFMIFTEGKTEEGYFKSFKVRCKSLNGGDVKKLVEEAIIQKGKSIAAAKGDQRKMIDQYWLVFDQDNSSKVDFSNAIEKAIENDIKLAYSCPCFELWFLFHFEKIEAHLTKAMIEKRLKRNLSDYSARNKGVEQGVALWYKLNSQLDAAINNAKSIHGMIGSDKDAFNKTVTSVYKLIEELREHR